MQWRIYIDKFQAHVPHFLGKFFLIFKQFSGKFGQIIGLALPLNNPRSTTESCMTVNDSESMEDLKAWNKSRKRLPLKVVINLTSQCWCSLSFWIRYCKSYQKLGGKSLFSRMSSPISNLKHDHCVMEESLSLPLCHGQWRIYKVHAVADPGFYKLGHPHLIILAIFPETCMKMNWRRRPWHPTPQLDPPMIPVQFV